MRGELREIGSEFWDVPLLADIAQSQSDTILGRQLDGHFDDTSHFSSGRAAFAAILDDAIEKYGIRSILLPSYCCESIIKPAADRNLAIEFYRVVGDIGQGMEIDFGNLSADALLIIDYFGLSSFDNNCHSHDSLVIRDLTHSLFSSRPMERADYCFGSLRKWAGFCTGGIAWSSMGRLNPAYVEGATAYISTRKQAMERKRRYMHGEANSKEYLIDFHNAESLLEPAEIFAADDTDSSNLLKLDFNFIRETRRKNYSELMKFLQPMALFGDCDTLDTPLFFPILVDPSERDALRDYLIAHQVYCPIHWPVPNEKARSLASRLYSSELSLICDQRYDEHDMRKISDIVISFWSQ